MPDFIAGRHEAQIAALDDRMCRVESGVERMNGKLDKVIVSLAEKRGERRAVAWIASTAGGIAALIVTLIIRAVFK